MNIMKQEDFDFLALQKDQFSHDQRNHSDITCLHKNDRLKHYGLHFAKYVGRLARGSSETISTERTIIDCTLVSLSAANTLHQNLSEVVVLDADTLQSAEALLVFADAAGRFSDACEKIDHMEDFIGIARTANIDIFRWVLQQAAACQICLTAELTKRRKFLAKRQFFIGL
jgi:hypothetical protein